MNSNLFTFLRTRLICNELNIFENKWTGSWEMELFTMEKIIKSGQ